MRYRSRAQAAYKSSCNKTALVNAINSWKNSWDDVINTVRTYANPGAMIHTMTIYYPHPNKDRTDTCSGQPVLDTLLPLGLAASHYMCATAVEEGWRCADALRAINCPTDDARCPDLDWLNRLEAGIGTMGGNSCPRVNGGMFVPRKRCGKRSRARRCERRERWAARTSAQHATEYVVGSVGIGNERGDHRALALGQIAQGQVERVDRRTSGLRVATVGAARASAAGGGANQDCSHILTVDEDCW